MWSWETCGLLLKRLQAESIETLDENANLDRLERVCRMTEIEDFQGPHSLPYAPLYIKDPREYFDCQQANALKSLGDSRAGIKPTDRSPSFGEAYISLAEQISVVKVKGLSDPVVQPEIALKAPKNDSKAPPPSSKPAKSGRGKQKKKKWSKGRQKEKVNNAVLFDQASYDKMLPEAPKYKQITPSVLSERLRVSKDSTPNSIMLLRIQQHCQRHGALEPPKDSTESSF